MQALRTTKVVTILAVAVSLHSSKSKKADAEKCKNHMNEMQKAHEQKCQRKQKYRKAKTKREKKSPAAIN